MGDQQERPDKRGHNRGQNKHAGALFPRQREPCHDNRWRQKLQHGGRCRVGFFNRQQEGELHGERADQREKQQAEGVFAMLDDRENLVAVNEGERQQDHAGKQQANHGQVRRRNVAFLHDVLRANAGTAP